MSYTAPTVESFKEVFPEFAGVADAIVQRAIDGSGRRVDTSWFEGDYTEAREWYTAHTLTLQGHGTGSEAIAIASGGAAFTSMSSGAVSVSRRASADEAGASPVNSLLNATAAGRKFLELLRLNKGGPRVAYAAGY